MPKLNLTEEDIASLELRTLMTENAIASLLRFFVDDETNIAVHEVVSSIGDLERIFISVINDRGRDLTPEEEYRAEIHRGERPITPPREEHLVILKVTSTNQESQESYDHYVGLRIKTDMGFGTLESSCIITYIDSIGNSIDVDMKATIEKTLKKAFEQTSLYWGTPYTTSYDNLTGEALWEPHYVNERYITIIFNDYVYNGVVQSSYSLNSGLFLIYLLVCLERNISLVSLEHVADRDGSSERIAEELRNIYLKEHAKDQSDSGEPRGLAIIPLGRFIGPTNYQYDDNPFRWQIQEQQEYFTELLSNAHSIGRDQYLEIGSLINRKIVSLTREGKIGEIWETIINQLTEEAIRKIIRIIDNDLSYEAYFRHVDNEKERREAIRQRAEDEFEINHGGLDGPDRQLMRIEEGLDYEYESESESRSSTSSNSKSSNNNSSDSENESSSDSSTSDSSSSNHNTSDNNSSEEIDDRFDREYSEGWLGELEEYIDNKYDNAHHRYWAREELERIHNEDISILLKDLFSPFDIDFMISQAIDDSGLVSLLFEDINFIDSKIKEWIKEVFRNSDFEIGNLISQTKFILLIRSIVSPIFSGTSEYYAIFLEKFSETYRKTLLFESQDFRIDFIEDLYNKAAARHDLIEMQAIWSVYSRMRKKLIENLSPNPDIDIKEAIQEAIDRNVKYTMRLYPHNSVKRLIYTDEEGDETSFDLLQHAVPLASTAREAKTKVSSKSKDANIFIPKIVFLVEETQGETRKKFITIELDLTYTSRLLSHNKDDRVMKNAGVNYAQKSKEDSLKGARLIETAVEEIKEIEEAELKQFKCSERVFIELLRDKQNIDDIVALLAKEIIYQFNGDAPTDNGLFLITSITFMGFSSQSPCRLCAPALIWLQNSFQRNEPVGMLIELINTIIKDGLQLATRGYNAEKQTQDYSKIKIDTIIYSDMNSNPQADDMADKLTHRNCKHPKATYNPKAKLFLPRESIDVSKSYGRKIEVEGVPTYIKPYIIEYCSAIGDQPKKETNFCGIACISGDKSESHRMNDLFKAHDTKASKTSNPTHLPTSTSHFNIDAINNRNFEAARQQSIKEAEEKQEVGPREIIGFDIEDVKDDGNCFYHAIANQMKVINYNWIQNVPVGTDPNNSLRLAVQGANFRDREWADDSTFDMFVTEFPDVILAVIDTRNPNAGFTLYYMGNDGNVITNMGDHNLVIPNDRMIIRIAATGNHFMSVISHPDITNGAITDAWDAASMQLLPSNNVFFNETHEQEESQAQEDQNGNDLTTESAVVVLGMVPLLLFTSHDSSSTT